MLGGFRPPPVAADFPGSFVPDQFILAVAALETLARHWARVYKITVLKNSSERLGRFLVEHSTTAVTSDCVDGE